MLHYFELWVFPAKVRIVYNQIWKVLGKIELHKNLCRIHVLLVFDMFHWLYCFCIVYIENNFKNDLLIFPMKITAKLTSNIDRNGLARKEIFYFISSKTALNNIFFCFFIFGSCTRRLLWRKNCVKELCKKSV